nr:MAG: hypothetical protein [Microvirus sp.]
MEPMHTTKRQRRNRPARRAVKKKVDKVAPVALQLGLTLEESNHETPPYFQPQLQTNRPPSERT